MRATNKYKCFTNNMEKHMAFMLGNNLTLIISNSRDQVYI